MNDTKVKSVLAQARSAYEPSEADRDRVYRNVVAAIAATGAATAGEAAASKVGSGSAAGSLVKGNIILKLGILGMLVGGAIIVVTGVVEDEEAQTAAPLSVARQPALVSGEPNQSTAKSDEEIQATTQLTQADEEMAAPGISPLDKPESAPATQKKKSSTARKSTGEERAESGDDSLLEEMSLIRKASQALRRGDFKLAMLLLNEHKEKFADGKLKQEREGLRVLTLCEEGASPEAAKAKRDFLRSSPNSPLAVRIKQECKDIGGTDE